MKGRDKEMFQPFPFWEQLKLPAEDGKMREIDCAISHLGSGGDCYNIVFQLIISNRVRTPKGFDP